MASIHGRADAGLQIIENIAAVIAGCAAMVVMVLVTCDAMFRYVLNTPLTFQHHLTQFYLLVMLGALPLAWGYRTGGSIQVSLLIERLPAVVSAPLIRLGLLASSLYLGAIAWRSSLEFYAAWSQGRQIMGVIDWPVAWSWVWIPVGCGLLALRLIVDATAPTLRPIGNCH